MHKTINDHDSPEHFPDPPPDVAQEILARGGLSLGQVARRIPPFRQGRPVSPSTVWRWITCGVKLPDGTTVRLEAARLSGRWFTSEGALRRFVAAQTPETDCPSSPRPGSPTARMRAAKEAAAELDQQGF